MCIVIASNYFHYKQKYYSCDLTLIDCILIIVRATIIFLLLCSFLNQSVPLTINNKFNRYSQLKPDLRY